MAGAVLAGDEQQGLDDGADAVVRDGERVLRRAGAAAVDQGVQGLVQVEVRALDPVGELLVGEAVAAAGGDEEALGEDGGGPAGAAAEPRRGRAPREHRLERLPVQLALPGAEAAPGGLVDLAGDLGGEPAYGGAAQAVRRGQPDGDAQAHQVEVGREDVVAVDAGCAGASGWAARTSERRRRVRGWRASGPVQGALGDAVAGAGLAGLVAR